MIGKFSNSGREWQPKGEPLAVNTYNFPSDAEGKAIPYGVYDMKHNDALVNVGSDHDTPEFAVASNGYRCHLWKYEIQKFANETDLAIEASHLPPGTSKWNKIEHRLFCHITRNWRGIRTKNGLSVTSFLDANLYPKGKKVTEKDKDEINITKNSFHGEWNYVISSNGKHVTE